MIWILGNRGLLGAELASVLERRGVPFEGSGRDVDIRDRRALEGFARGKDIDWIINCAAYTAVDAAEDNEAEARDINVSGAENVARLSRRTGARLIHISTDYVFDGASNRPYRESDSASPLCAYGRTKADGEQLATSAAPETIIVRTAWLYGEYGPNFVSAVLGRMREENRIDVVADQTGSPTWARDLADALADIASHGGIPPGIYHFAGAGGTSRLEYALEVYRLGRERGLLRRACRLDAAESSLYPAKARRPAYSVLDTSKIRAAGVEVPSWEDSLARFIGTIPSTQGERHERDSILF